MKVTTPLSLGIIIYYMQGRSWLNYNNNYDIQIFYS